MDKYTPPPETLSERIRNMEPKTTILVTDSTYDTVKARVSQLRHTFRPRRAYRTSKKENGTRIWRDA